MLFFYYLKLRITRFAKLCGFSALFLEKNIEENERNMRLIFCDTFVQDPSDGTVSNTWSAIEFQSPVVLEEIRVVQRGNRVHDQLGAEGQFGKTSPGSFRIDFFSCDVNNKDASTFENLCALEYNEATNTCVTSPRLSIVIDKLICCGRYTAVTLAVFGAEASDVNAVRSIREKQSIEAKKLSQPPIPPVQDNFQNPGDEPQPGPYPGRQLQPPLQPVDMSPSNPPFHRLKPEKADPLFPPTDPANYSTPSYDSRSYHGRQNNNYQYRNHRQRDNYYNKPNMSQNMQDPSNEQGHLQRRHETQQYERFLHERGDFRFSKHGLDWGGPGDTAEYGRHVDEFNAEHDKKNTEQYDSNVKEEQQNEEEWEGTAFEDISDEEMDEEAAANIEAMMAEDMLLPSSMMSFNPFHMDVYPLSHFTSPELSQFDLLRNKLHVLEESDVEESKKNPSKILIDKAKNLEKLIVTNLKLCPTKHEESYLSSTKQSVPTVLSDKEGDWVTSLEKIVPLVLPGLPYLEINDDLDYTYILCTWAITGLQMDGAIPKLIGVNVRSLKASLGLAQRLCETAADIVEQVTAAGLADNLFNILRTNHIASSIKISAIHVLDAMTNWPSQMHDFLFGDEGIPSLQGSSNPKSAKKTGYASVIELALDPQAARVANALSQLTRKAHIYECMNELQVLTQSFVLHKIPEEFVYVSDEDSNDEEEYSHEEEAEELPVSSTLIGEEEMMDVEVRPTSGDESKRKAITPEIGLHLSQEGNNEDQNFSQAVSSNPSALENLTVPIQSVMSLEDVTVSEEELSNISDCLKQILSAFQNPSDVIGQLPVQRFPLSKNHLPSVDKHETTDDVTAVYRMSEGTGLLLSVQALLTLPVVSGHKGVFESCSLFLEELMKTKHGLLHLLSNSDCVLHIIHHLMKSTPHLDVETPRTAGYLGAKLAFHIHAMQSVDHISSLLESEAEVDDVEEELCHAFKGLFSLTYPHFGKYYVSKVLGLDDLLSPILLCLWYPSKFTDPDPAPEENSEETKKSASDAEKSDKEETAKTEEENLDLIHHKTAVNSYAASLVHLVLTMPSGTGYIYKHLVELTRFCLSKRHVTLRSEQFKQFLSPLEKNIIGDDADIGKLVEFIKEKSSLLEWTSLTIDGPGICTALKLLCHLCIKGNGRKTDAASRLKVLALFSVDALNILLSLCDQLHKSLHYFCHGIHAMVTGMLASTHILITSMCSDILSLLHLMLFQVLDSPMDGKNMNGIHITRAIVALHSDVYILLRPVDTALLHTFTGKVVSIFALFFAHSKPSEMTNTIITEIIKYVQTQCDNFIPTLMLLSQLLPMPLPIATPTKPPEDSRVNAVSACMVWSKCISPHVNDLIDFLLPLSSSTCRSLIEVVVMLVQQIVDLSPSLALTIVKRYSGDVSPLLVSTVIKENKEDAMITDAEDGDKEFILSPGQVTSIQTFSEILTLPTTKSAVISHLHEGADKLMDLWMYGSNIQTPPEDVSAILLLISVLVDTEFSLHPVEDAAHSLADRLPPVSHLKSIVKLAVSQTSNSSSRVSSRAFLVLALLYRTRLAVPYVRNELLKAEDGFFKALKMLSDNFDSSSTHCVDSLFNLFEFLFLLLDRTNDKSGKKELRYSLSNSQLRRLLRWESNDEGNPIMILESMTQKLFTEDALSSSGIAGLYDRVTSLRQSLASESSTEDIPELEELAFPDPTPLLEQFANRPVFVIDTEDSRLHTQLSLTAPSRSTGLPPDGDEQRLVQCDLIATAEKFCPGYDLAEQLEKSAKAVDVQRVAEETDAMTKRRQKMETYSARLGKSLTFMKRSHGILMAQQQQQQQQQGGRGRGRGRGRGNPANRPFDLFRHRKQNTSRPPSMHVDDFVAADEEQEKNESEEQFFKSPPPLVQPSRRPPPLQTFKPREFIPRGRGSGRGSRNSSYRARGGFYQGSHSNISPLNKFRPRPQGNGRGNRMPERFRGISSRPNASRMSFSPIEGYKTNKQESSDGWDGGFNRDYPGGGLPYRGRGSKLMKGPRGSHSFVSPNYKQWGGGPPSFHRSGRPYNRARGKHMRSSTR